MIHNRLKTTDARLKTKDYFYLGRLALSPCGLATYDMQTEMSSLPAGGLCLPAGKHTGILTFFKHKSTKKAKKTPFLGRLFYY